MRTVVFLLAVTSLAACADEGLQSEHRSSPQGDAPGWMRAGKRARIASAEVREVLENDPVWITGELVSAESWRPLPGITSKNGLLLWYTEPRFPVLGSGFETNVPGSTLTHPEIELRASESFEEFRDPDIPVRAGAYLLSAAGVALALELERSPPDGRFELSYPTGRANVLRSLPMEGESAGSGGWRAIGLSQQTRQARFLPPPGLLQSARKLPRSARMRFSFGFERFGVEARNDRLIVGDGTSDGVGFAVDVIDSSGARRVFDRFLHPEECNRYHDAVIELEEWSEKDVTIEIRTYGSPAEAGTTRDDYAIVARPRIDGDRVSRPNVLLVVLDTLRADGLSCYGNPRGLTPRLDELARDGVRFANARSSSSWTLPSHASLFTSLLPTQHGVLRENRRLSSSAETLAEVLRDHGWHTAAITDGGYVIPAFGFAQGFDLFDARAGGVEAVCARALEWIERSARPFFLFLHTYEIHFPYEPPAAFERRWVRHEGKEAPPADLTPEHVRYLHDRYEAGIAYTDEAWGRFFERLEELDLRDDTLVIVTSDHGEEFLEHGGLGHRLTLYEEQLRVPLLVRYPGIFEGGRVVDEAVRLIDVAPTIADVADVPIPSAWQGISLRHPRAHRDFLAVLEVGAQDGLRGYAILEGERKWIHSEPGFYGDRGFASRELYDLSSDPGERSSTWESLHDVHVEGLLSNLLERYAPLFTGDRMEVDLSSRESKDLEALGY